MNESDITQPYHSLYTVASEIEETVLGKMMKKMGMEIVMGIAIGLSV